MSRFRAGPAHRAARGSDLKGSARRVWTELVEAANRKGEAWPSVQTLAEWTGMGPSTVREGLKALEAAGAIHLEGHTSKGIRMWSLHPAAIGHVVEDPPESEPCQNLEGCQNLAVGVPDSGGPPTYSDQPNDQPKCIGPEGPDVDGAQMTMPGVEPPPTEEEALALQVEAVCALWGLEVNPALGRNAVGAGAYGVKTRKLVAQAINQHGADTVLDAMRVLVDHPAGDWFRRKAATSDAARRWLTLPWYLKRDLGEAAAQFRDDPGVERATTSNLREVEYDPEARGVDW